MKKLLSLTALFVFVVILFGCDSSNNSDDLLPSCVDLSLIDPEVICNQEYAPVCGCDNNTYSNACIALNSAGIIAYAQLACE